MNRILLVASQEDFEALSTKGDIPSHLWRPLQEIRTDDASDNSLGFFARERAAFDGNQLSDEQNFLLSQFLDQNVVSLVVLGASPDPLVSVLQTQIQWHDRFRLAIQTSAGERRKHLNLHLVVVASAPIGEKEFEEFKKLVGLQGYRSVFVMLSKLEGTDDHLSFSSKFVWPIAISRLLAYAKIKPEIFDEGGIQAFRTFTISPEIEPGSVESVLEERLNEIWESVAKTKTTPITVKRFQTSSTSDDLLQHQVLSPRNPPDQSAIWGQSDLSELLPPVDLDQETDRVFQGRLSNWSLNDRRLLQKETQKYWNDIAENFDVADRRILQEDSSNLPILSEQWNKAVDAETKLRTATRDQKANIFELRRAQWGLLPFGERVAIGVVVFLASGTLGFAIVSTLLKDNNLGFYALLAAFSGMLVTLIGIYLTEHYAGLRAYRKLLEHAQEIERFYAYRNNTLLGIFADALKRRSLQQNTAVRGSVEWLRRRLTFLAKKGWDQAAVDTGMFSTEDFPNSSAKRQESMHQQIVAYRKVVAVSSPLAMPTGRADDKWPDLKENLSGLWKDFWNDLAKKSDPNSLGRFPSKLLVTNIESFSHSTQILILIGLNESLLSRALGSQEATRWIANSLEQLKDRIHSASYYGTMSVQLAKEGYVADTSSPVFPLVLQTSLQNTRGQIQQILANTIQVDFSNVLAAFPWTGIYLETRHIDFELKQENGLRTMQGIPRFKRVPSHE